jgi:hypothetical protein
MYDKLIGDLGGQLSIFTLRENLANTNGEDQPGQAHDALSKLRKEYVEVGIAWNK